MHAVLRKHTDVALMLLETPHVNVNMQDNVCGGECACVCVCVCVCLSVCMSVYVHVNVCFYVVINFVVVSPA